MKTRIIYTQTSVDFTDCQAVKSVEYFAQRNYSFLSRTVLDGAYNLSKAQFEHMFELWLSGKLVSHGDWSRVILCQRRGVSVREYHSVKGFKMHTGRTTLHDTTCKFYNQFFDGLIDYLTCPFLSEVAINYDMLTSLFSLREQVIASVHSGNYAMASEIVFALFRTLLVHVTFEIAEILNRGETLWNFDDDLAWLVEYRVRWKALGMQFCDVLVEEGR